MKIVFLIAIVSFFCNTNAFGMTSDANEIEEDFSHLSLENNETKKAIETKTAKKRQGDEAKVYALLQHWQENIDREFDKNGNEWTDGVDPEEVDYLTLTNRLREIFWVKKFNVTPEVVAEMLQELGVMVTQNEFQKDIIEVVWGFEDDNDDDDDDDEDDDEKEDEKTNKHKEEEKVPMIRTFICMGTDFNYMPEQYRGRGVTPLRHFAKQGYKELCRLLIKAGVNVNAQDHYGNTPLHCAVRAGHVAVCEDLVTKAHINRKNDDGDTALVVAQEAGVQEIYNLLVKHGADEKELENYELIDICVKAFKNCSNGPFVVAFGNDDSTGCYFMENAGCSRKLVLYTGRGNQAQYPLTKIADLGASGNLRTSGKLLVCCNKHTSITDVVKKAIKLNKFHKLVSRLLEALDQCEQESSEGEGDEIFLEDIES